MTQRISDAEFAVACPRCGAPPRAYCLNIAPPRRPGDPPGPAHRAHRPRTHAATQPTQETT